MNIIYDLVSGIHIFQAIILFAKFTKVPHVSASGFMSYLRPYINHAGIRMYNLNFLFSDIPGYTDYRQPLQPMQYPKAGF